MGSYPAMAKGVAKVLSDTLEEFKDIEIANGGASRRYLCTNCRTNIHNVAGAKKGQPVEILQKICSNSKCMCPCTSFYVAKNGRLRRLGTVDDTDPLQGLHNASDGSKRSSTDDLIDKLNAQIKQEKQENVPLS